MVPFVGQKIKWVSAAGPLTGVVKNIRQGLNAASVMIDWIDVEITSTIREGKMVTFPVSYNYFAMMKIEEI